MKRLMLITAMLGVAACKPAAPAPSAEPEPTASAVECPEIPDPPRTDIPDCDRAWRVRWCWIERTGQSDAYRAGFQAGFENLRIDVHDPMPREQVQQGCIEALDKAREDAEPEGCWANACVE